MSASRGRYAVALLAVVLVAPMLGACTIPPPGGPTACNLPAATAGSTTQTLTVGGTARHYELAIPPGYSGKARVPLVFDFAGAGSFGSIMDIYTQMSVKAAPLGWIVVSPDALSFGGSTFWTIPPKSTTDLDFVSAMLRSLSTRLCVDPQRVYATGLSDGAILSDALACAMPGTFAAVAPVGAVNTTPVCKVGTPRTSLITFHGTADPIFNYEGDPNASTPYAAVPWAVASWAAFDGCDLHATTSTVAWDVTHTVYAACTQGTGVELFTILGGGHNWPDGYQFTSPYGRTTTSIDATDLILRFFAAHPRRT